MTEEVNKGVHDLELHESTVVESEYHQIIVTRVPGGWLYNTSKMGTVTSTFVPYQRE